MGCCNFFLRLGFVTGTGGEREEPARWNCREQNVRWGSFRGQGSKALKPHFLKRLTTFRASGAKLFWVFWHFKVWDLNSAHRTLSHSLPPVVRTVSPHTPRHGRASRELRPSTPIQFFGSYSPSCPLPPPPRHRPFPMQFHWHLEVPTRQDWGIVPSC